MGWVNRLISAATGREEDWKGIAGAGLVAKGHRIADISATVTALADVGEIDVAVDEQIMLEVSVAAAALSAFVVQARAHASGSYHTWLSDAADYTNPEGALVAASGDLTTQGTSTPGWLVLDVRGVESLKIRAAGTSSVVTVRKGGN